MNDDKHPPSPSKAPHADSVSPQAREHYLRQFAERWAPVTPPRAFGGEEGFIPGNRLTLAESVRYDVILADCSFNMLTWEEMPILAAKVRALLKEDGVSIQRIQAAPDSLTLDMIGPAVASYRRESHRLAFVFF